MRRVIFMLFSLRTSNVGGGGGALPNLLFYFVSCSADHERIGHRVKYQVVFLGLATNTLIVRNNNNNQKFDFTFDEAKERLVHPQV